MFASSLDTVKEEICKFYKHREFCRPFQIVSEALWIP